MLEACQSITLMRARTACGQRQHRFPARELFQAESRLAALPRRKQYLRQTDSRLTPRLAHTASRWNSEAAPQHQVGGSESSTKPIVNASTSSLLPGRLRWLVPERDTIPRCGVRAPKRRFGKPIRKEFGSRYR